MASTTPEAVIIERQKRIMMLLSAIANARENGSDTCFSIRPMRSGALTGFSIGI